MIRTALLLAALAGGPDTGPGACLVLEGDEITAQDLAPAWAALAVLPRETVFGYAPAPGVRRSFYLPELSRLAARYQVAPPAAPICVERAVEPLDRNRLLAAMRAALELPEARLEIVEYSRYAAPRGELEFPRAGLSSGSASRPDTPLLWKGWVRYAGNRRFAVWVRVRITSPLRRVVAAEALPAGQPVRPEQLRLEPYEGIPFRRTEAAASEEVVGKVSRHAIPAGAPIPLAWLAEPPAVNRGDEVAIAVETGAARLTFQGRAESAGWRGETVAVRNITSGKTFPARVAGQGRVVVTVDQPAGDRQASGEHK
jgi:flagella basal body P-ring formation protein FlgA